jgi:hypothetical protein
MTCEIFESWLLIFIRTVKQRPLLLVFDGHRAHISLNAIKLARDNGVALLKLPSHLTHKLQPCDVSVMKALKHRWDESVEKFQREEGLRIPSKGEQVNLMSSIWSQALKKTTIQNGFEETGIFPLNRDKYPQILFDPLRLASYRMQHGIVQLGPTSTFSTSVITSSVAGPSSSAVTAPCTAGPSSIAVSTSAPGPSCTDVSFSSPIVPLSLDIPKISPSLEQVSFY